MKLKRCIKPFCGRIFNETDEEFEDGFCDCGAALEDYTPIAEEEEQSTEVHGESNNGEQCGEDSLFERNTEQIAVTLDESSQSEPKEIRLPLYFITSGGEIFFQEDNTFQEMYERQSLISNNHDENEDCNGDRIVLLHDRIVFKNFPIEFDEMVIGRESKGTLPDIDLTEIDLNRKVSRRHALVYRFNQNYFIRNLSNKNTLHVDRQPVAQNEEMRLEDGSTIVLSGEFGLIFYQTSGEME